MQGLWRIPRPIDPCEVSTAVTKMARLKRHGKASLGSSSKSVYEFVVCVKISNCSFLLLMGVYSQDCSSRDCLQRLANPCLNAVPNKHAKW